MAGYLGSQDKQAAGNQQSCTGRERNRADAVTDGGLGLQAMVPDCSQEGQIPVGLKEEHLCWG